MQKKYPLILIALTLVFCLAGCECAHKWNDATCTAAKTCSLCGTEKGSPKGHQWKPATCTAGESCTLCGAVNGEPTGHQWQDASCTAPVTCSVCNEINGTPLGHSWKEATCTEAAICYTCGQTTGKPNGHKITEWSVSQQSTCTEEGTQTGQCTICGEAVVQALALAEHTPGQWVVTTEATQSSQGTRTQSCSVCSKELQTEQFSMTAEELEKAYKAKCKKISYKSLARTPGEYKDAYVKFSGRVVQVCSEASSSLYYSTYRVATSGKYDNVVYIYVDNYGSGSRILEGDKITFYGKFDGLYTYETVMGSSLTIPSIKVEYID